MAKPTRVHGEVPSMVRRVVADEELVHVGILADND